MELKFLILISILIHQSGNPVTSLKELNKTCQVPFNKYDEHIKEDVLRRGLDERIVQRMIKARKDVDTTAELKKHLQVPDQKSFDQLQEATRI